MRRISVLLAFAVLAACSKEAKKSGPFVAEGDGVTVTAGEMKKKLDEQSPFVRARYATLDRKKEFLENLIRFELLAKEARARGLDKDPEVQETLQKVMVQKLVRQAFDDEKAKPSDDEVRKYYDAHADEFVKPERVRISAVFFNAPAGSPQRATKAAEAKRALARVKSEGPKNPLAFSNVARELSEDAASKASGGDLGYRTRDELTKQYSAELANASFTLKEGQESGVVETPQGFALVKLGARQAPINRPFDEVKAQLAARIGREARTKDFDEFIKKLREKSSIKVNDAELEKIVVSAPPQQAGPLMPAAQGPAGATPAGRP
jgi:peptidyl-prolyl cis-trans isomerase C